MNEKKEISIKDMIYEIRGFKVMLDRDLADLYCVDVKRLNENVKRNLERFPSDFMFKLNQVEWDILRSQFATANKNIIKVRFLPYAFTEHGILMLSNVLYSKEAINMSIQIIRTFEKLRKYTLKQSPNEIKFDELYKLLMLHIENNDHKFLEQDNSINKIIKVLNNLLEKPKEAKKIGFT